VRALALMLISVGTYQTVVLSLVAQEAFTPNDAIQPAHVLGALFISILVMQIDSYVFLRAGFHADGLRLLAHAGLDISGGAAAKITGGLFLAIRILLSLGFAQLTAIFVGILIFRADVGAEINRSFLRENAALIAQANAHADAEIARATETAKQAERNAST